MLDSATKEKIIHDYNLMDVSQNDVILVQNISDPKMVIWTTIEELENNLDIQKQWKIIGYLKDFISPNLLIDKLNSL